MPSDINSSGASLGKSLSLKSGYEVMRIAGTNLQIQIAPPGRMPGRHIGSRCVEVGARRRPPSASPDTPVGLPNVKDQTLLKCLTLTT